MTTNPFEKHRDEMKRSALSELSNMLRTIGRAARAAALWLEAEEHLASRSEQLTEPKIEEWSCTLGEDCKRCGERIEPDSPCFHNVNQPDVEAAHDHYCSVECAGTGPAIP